MDKISTKTLAAAVADSLVKILTKKLVEPTHATADVPDGFGGKWTADVYHWRLADGAEVSVEVHASARDSSTLLAVSAARIREEQKPSAVTPP